MSVAQQETVTIVETNPHKFKLDAGEIYKRKQFIALASAKLKEVTDDVNSSTTKGKLDRDKRDVKPKKKKKSFNFFLFMFLIPRRS